MSEFRKIVCQRHLAKRAKLDKSYSWKRLLHSFEEGNAQFVPVEAFSQHLAISLNDIVTDGVFFEIRLHDYDEILKGVEVRWFGSVEKVCGYQALCCLSGDTTKFWIHLLSDDIYSLGDASRIDPPMATHIYSPPKDKIHEFSTDLKAYVKNIIDSEVFGQKALSQSYAEHKRALTTRSRFRKGQRLELLNYTNSRMIRVARVVETCGRRISVFVMPSDSPLKNLQGEEDRQVENKSAQYWIDEDSFFIFPVGFAAVNNYPLQAKPDYIAHTRRIREAIRDGVEPEYHPDDIKFQDLQKPAVDAEHWKKLEIGQKLELIDPLAQQFQELRVASILSFLTTEGYLTVGIDGPDAFEDSFPIHINNLFMFPVGYAEEHGVKLTPPESYVNSKKEFKWERYLIKEKAEALPLQLFRTAPTQERLDMFKVGSYLEAADMCENQFICPASIQSVHGRIIYVNFEGWGDDYNELYDIDSHDIFPSGWCAYVGYKLEVPRGEPPSPTRLLETPL